MKTVKKLLCLGLSLIMVVGVFAGCHKANEVAITFGSGSNKVEITSGYYLCALIMSYQEAVQKVDSAKSEEKSSDTTSSAATSSNSEEKTDYLKEKIDNKSFTKWVEDSAMEKLVNYAALQHEIKANKVELSDEQKSQVDQYAKQYWTSYGYQDIYEKNGVSYDTFKKYMQASNEDYVYFEHLYGEDGEKAVKKSEVMKFIKEHFVAVDTAYYSLTDSDGNTVDSKTSDTYKKKLNNYADKLNAGKISFKKVYEAVNGKLQDGSTYSTFVGDDKTDYSISEFSKIKKLKKHKAIVVESDSAITLYYTQSITDSSYDKLKDSVIYNLKHDEFEEELDKIGKELKVDKNNYALKRLKVKNIDTSTDSNSTTAQ